MRLNLLTDAYLFCRWFLIYDISQTLWNFTIKNLSIISNENFKASNQASQRCCTWKSIHIRIVTALYKHIVSTLALVFLFQLAPVLTITIAPCIEGESITTALSGGQHDTASTCADSASLHRRTNSDMYLCVSQGWTKVMGSSKMKNCNT